METADLESIYEAVLSQELLLKKIVGYALNFASTTRLVNKHWLVATTRQCRKFGTPLFTISAQFGVSKCIATIGKMKSSLSSSLDENRLPPIKLQIYDTGIFFDNQNEFNTMFLECASSLTELEFYVAHRWMQFEFSLPSTIKLPGLRYVKICFFGQEGPSISKFTFQRLLDQLFRVSPNLRKVTTDSDMPDNQAFPASVTSLELNYALSNREINHLLQSELPNLQHLQLDLQNSENFTKVLAKLSPTLRSLTILKKRFLNWHSRVELQIPLMKKLNTLNIQSESIVLPDADTVNKLLPNLKILVLPFRAIDKLSKATYSPNMTGIGKTEDLTLLLCIGEGFKRLNQTMLYCPIVRGVSLAFPNLKKLTMELSFDRVQRLRAVFRDLSQLKILHIRVENNNLFVNSSIVDSILTGCTQSELRIHPLSFLIKCEQQSRNGIKRMTELEELGLRTTSFNTFTQFTTAAFSDLSFHLAFFEMPKLRKLSFGGMFKVTGEMKRQWEALGKNITLN